MLLYDDHVRHVAKRMREHLVQRCELPAASLSDPYTRTLTMSTEVDFDMLARAAIEASHEFKRPEKST